MIVRRWSRPRDAGRRSCCRRCRFVRRRTCLSCTSIQCSVESPRTGTNRRDGYSRGRDRDFSAKSRPWQTRRCRPYRPTCSVEPSCGLTGSIDLQRPGLSTRSASSRSPNAPQGASRPRGRRRSSSELARAPWGCPRRPAHRRCHRPRNRRSCCNFAARSRAANPSRTRSATPRDTAGRSRCWRRTGTWRARPWACRSSSFSDRRSSASPVGKYSSSKRRRFAVAGGITRVREQRRKGCEK